MWINDQERMARSVLRIPARRSDAGGEEQTLIVLLGPIPSGMKAENFNIQRIRGEL
jgi:hypothetical protein